MGDVKGPVDGGDGNGWCLVCEEGQDGHPCWHTQAEVDMAAEKRKCVLGKWEMVRPGLYKRRNAAREIVGTVERGSESRLWWWQAVDTWPRYAGGRSSDSEHGRATTMAAAKSEADRHLGVSNG